jgi:hypothetical protein
MNDFYKLAEAATKQYTKECPNVETIRFAIEQGILPNDYICEEPNACITARKSEKWSISGNALAKRPARVSRSKACLSQTFCQYKGGDVLNAIYEGDFAHFSKLDLEYTKGYDDLLKSLRTGNPILDGMYKRKSIIHSVINEYMFQYKSTSAGCLRDGYKTLVFKRRGSDISLQNIYGIEVHRIEGVDLESSYTVNADFIPICKVIGSAVGGSSLLHETGDDMFNSGLRTQVLNGVKDMMIRERCDSQRIRQFENNLRIFYQRIYG